MAYASHTNNYLIPKFVEKIGAEKVEITTETFGPYKYICRIVYPNHRERIIRVNDQVELYKELKLLGKPAKGELDV